jgi:hypothetical protein
MMGTWESLKINAKRGLLAAVIGPGGDVQAEARAPGFFDVYDIGHDCAHPRLLASVSGAQLGGITFGHEGGWSPDGRTYWASLAAGGGLNAIDVSDPTHPAALWAGQVTLYDHGFSISADGNRLYMAQAGNWAQGYTGAGLGDDTVEPNGLLIIDVSEIQQRRPMPQIHNVGHVFWTDGAAGQMSIPVTYAGKPYLVFVDELAQGAARIIDISDEANPRIVSKLKLEIDMPQYADLRSADADNRVAVYNGHYCTADRLTDPTALACGYFESGIRVFDIRDPHRPREIAYFNPPAQSDKIADLPGSEHPAFTTSADNVPLSADWCSSPPRFVGDQLWVICQDNGFMALRFTNGAWPFPESAGADLGLPSPRACASRRTFTIHLRAPKGQRLRSARVYVNGKRVGVVQGERLRAPVDLRGLPRGVVRVRIVARMRAGRTIVRERRYRTCTASR